MEIKDLHEKFKQEKQQIIIDHQQKIEDLTKFFEEKIYEQNTYITMLE